MRLLVAGFCALALVAAEAAPAVAATPKQILMWPNGAPGSEGKTSPETMRINPPDEQVISNVNFPSITPYLPNPKNGNGAAIVIIPGGGHKEIWVTHEGYREAQFFADRGIAAFVLKYRLSAAPGSTYTLMGDSLSDVQRAIRLVKSRAAEWHIDPSRVGVMGFSAGGELAALAGAHFDSGNPAATDPVDRESSRPAFLGLVYPYLGRILGVSPPDMPTEKGAPPAFLLGGDKDPISQSLPAFYLALERQGIPAELHMLTDVGHGFGIRSTNPPHVAIWPTLFYNWLDAMDFLKDRQGAP
jgi:acetyl esterase/lipase